MSGLLDDEEQPESSDSEDEDFVPGAEPNGKL
jgi:hypothetical protein